MLYLIKNIKNLIWTYIGVTIICVFMAFTSILTANMMGKVTQLFTEAMFNQVGINILITILVFILDGIVCLVYSVLCGKIESTTYSKIQQKSFYQISHISVESSLMNNQGDIYTRINSDTNEVIEYLSKNFPTILMQSIQLILISIYILVLDWRITIVYLLTLIVSLLLQSTLSNSLKKTSEQVKKNQVEMNICLKNNINNRITIKVYRAYNFINNLYEKIEKNLFHKNISFNIRAMPIHMVGILCGIMPIISLCLTGLFFIPKGILNISSFIAIFYLCQKILPYQLHYIDLFINTKKVQPSFNRIVELWKEPITFDKKNLKENNKDGTIILEDIWYKYPNTDNWIIKGISLNIPKGKKVAFIGKSGCGKSTLLKIIGGLALAQKGNVKVSNAILTSQFPKFFSGTIKENICCFENKENKDIMFSCENAEINDFLAELENGIDFDLKNNATNLSGGQRQRIALARALNISNSILLLDESLSALDSESANKVIEKIIKNYPEMTIVMVLHQQEFLPLMDEIYIFEDGEISGFGTYQQLIEQNLL